MNKHKANRQQRRASVSEAKRATRRGDPCEPLKVVHGVVNHPSALPGLVRALSNHTYAVQVFEPVVSGLGTASPVGIKRHDGGPNFPWQDLQRIKTEVAGADAVAIEVFPAEADLVDEANMRWLWVLPEGVRFRLTLPKGR